MLRQRRALGGEDDALIRRLRGELLGDALSDSLGEVLGLIDRPVVEPDDGLEERMGNSAEECVGFDRVLAPDDDLLQAQEALQLDQLGTVSL